MTPASSSNASAQADVQGVSRSASAIGADRSSMNARSSRARRASSCVVRSMIATRPR
jgi:hypothetical protein